MSLKTENLAIVLTDIAGYSETTARQSRLANERLLATHNRILFPIVRRFKGRHVKSIGDALLLVFRSPTDAMLCAMAMQDALFEYNRNASKEEQIHLRVAASLGEVRVTRGDVFGEPVNITSRIEGITPPDEIYMSEAVYMAMNKAEVPSQEVGWRELKGVTGKIRIFNIPRFATPRLVPQDVMAAEDMSDLVYPYGGAHLAAQAAEGESWRVRLSRSGAARAALAVAVLAPVLLFAAYVGKKAWSQRAASQPLVAREFTPPPPPVPAQYQPEFSLSESKPAGKPAPKAATPAKPAATASKPAAPASPPRYEPEFDIKKDSPPTPKTIAEGITRLSDAKKAYKAEKIGKDDYKRAVQRIEKQIEQEVDQAKRDYKSDRITKKQYKDRLDAIEKKYK